MEEEEEIPLKIIELSDFLRSPSILSKKLYFKQMKNDQSNKSDGLKFKDMESGIILLKQKSICSDNEPELIVPKDVIIFADDTDRKKIGLIKKSTNQFSRFVKQFKSNFVDLLILDIY
jgi:hypothetical protein